MDGKKTAAEAYERVQCRYQASDGVGLIDRLGLGRGNVVLDLGCGTGYLSSVLAERVGREGRVVGVDPNTDRLEIAKRNFSQIDNLHFVAGSSENFPRGLYDAIFSAHVMHWIRDKENAFRRAHENLKVGGIFAFLCADGNIGNSIRRRLNPAADEEPLFYWSSEEYERLATECGFKIDLKSVETERYEFENIDKYIEWSVATMGVAPDAIDPDAISDVRKRFEPYFEWNKVQFILKRTC